MVCHLENACSFYAPDYIKQDPKTYRLAQDVSQPTVSLCPTCAATWERDNAALQAVMAHLAEYDAERTVILFQVENEPGILAQRPLLLRRLQPGIHRRRLG